MRVSHYDSIAKIDGVRVQQPKLALPADVYDTLLLGSEAQDGVDAGNCKHCPLGLAVWLDGADDNGDMYDTDNAGPCLAALTRTGFSIYAFDAAIVAVRGPGVRRVPLLHVFNHLGITRGAR